MRVAIFFLFVMVYVVSVHFSEVQGGNGTTKECTHPKGNDGESSTEGCIKQTCKSGVWRPSLDDSICCFEREAFAPNTTINETTEGCIKTSIDCITNENKAEMVLNVVNICQTLPSANTVEEMKQMLEDHMAKTDKLDCCCQSEATTTATTTSTTVATTTTAAIEGVLITGGTGAAKSTEVFIPHTGKTCRLPDLPYNVAFHTLNTVDNKAVICGGNSPDSSTPATLVSCVFFVPELGVWPHYSTTIQRREDHTSWVSSAGLVLIGGGHSGMDTDIVPNGGGNFSLLHNAKWACAIADKDSTIITGGKYTPKVAARYNLQGHVENLPEINQGRANHGCGSYFSSGTMVLIVAGGYADNSRLSSTEQMTVGATAWTTIKPLPRTMIAPRIVTLNNNILLTGGEGRNNVLRSEILAFDGEDWKEVGKLLMARAYHAVTKIDTTDIMRFCN